MEFWRRYCANYVTLVTHTSPLFGQFFQKQTQSLSDQKDTRMTWLSVRSILLRPPRMGEHKPFGDITYSFKLSTYSTSTYAELSSHAEGRTTTAQCALTPRQSVYGYNYKANCSDAELDRCFAPSRYPRVTRGAIIGYTYGIAYSARWTYLSPHKSPISSPSL